VGGRERNARGRRGRPILGLWPFARAFNCRASLRQTTARSPIYFPSGVERLGQRLAPGHLLHPYRLPPNPPGPCPHFSGRGEIRNSSRGRCAGESHCSHSRHLPISVRLSVRPRSSALLRTPPHHFAPFRCLQHRPERNDRSPLFFRLLALPPPRPAFPGLGTLIGTLVELPSFFLSFFLSSFYFLLLFPSFLLSSTRLWLECPIRGKDLPPIGLPNPP
jgi:hypothetical protein